MTLPASILQVIRHTRNDNTAFEKKVLLHQQSCLAMQDLVADLADHQLREDNGNHPINSVRAEAL